MNGASGLEAGRQPERVAPARKTSHDRTRLRGERGHRLVEVGMWKHAVADQPVDDNDAPLRHELRHGVPVLFHRRREAYDPVGCRRMPARADHDHTVIIWSYFVLFMIRAVYVLFIDDVHACQNESECVMWMKD